MFQGSELTAGPQISSLNTNDPEWHLNFEIPELCTFSSFVKEAVKTGIVSSRARREITQVLRTYIIAYTVHPTSEQYTTVCRKLVSKYPALEDTQGNSRIVSKGNFKKCIFISYVSGIMEIISAHWI